MPEPYTLVLEFSRAREAGNPFAMRMEPQAYNRRLDDKTYKDAELSWDEPFVAAIEALRAPKRDPEIVQRLGNALRAFLDKTGWSREEAALSDAVELEHPVVLTIRSGAAELYALPWELLALGQSTRHVGALPNVTIRYEWTGTRTKGERPSPRPAGGRVLLAYSHAGGKVLANEHIEAIQDACDRIEHPFDVDRDVLAQASHRTLGDALEDAKKMGKPISVLHILCHGGPIGSTFGLMLDPDEPGGPPGVDSDSLAGLIAEHADMIRLCVVIACDSGNTGRLGNQMGSVAQAIHRAGVAAVVASRYPFSVKGAGEFVRAFYETLLVGSVEEAFVAGRQRLVKAGSGLDWASVQLYAREDDGFDTRPIVFGPYRGLLAFERRHARFFFGRNGKDMQGKDREVDQLVGKLTALGDRDEPRFIVVAGDSGTGKSSMVLASAVPGLEGSGWKSQVMRPGSAPMPALEEALKRAPPSPARGLLVVDQFEEVFTSVTRPEDRTAFVQRLWELSQERGGWGVITTVRIDFLGRCGEILLDKEKGLRLDRIACDPAHQVLVAQMDALQLRDAIEKPALAAGLSLEHGLTDRILGDVDQEPGALPLMQHTLRLMWEKREGRALTQAAYAALNKVIGALNMHADGVVDDLVRADAENQQTVRRLLLGLVNVGHGDAPNMRRRAMIAELRPEDAAGAARFDAVLGMLVDQRLLVRSGTGRGQTIEVAHEALIRRWERLGGWIKEERGKLLARDDLLGWVEGCTKNGELLSRGQLEMADQLLKDAPELVKGEARDLVQRSHAEMDRVKEQARRFRDTLRVALAREYLTKDPLVSVVLLREVEAKPPASVRTWFECAMEALWLPAMTTMVLEGHDDEVTSAVFSPDGTRVVTASYDGTARVWSAATGEPILTFAGHTTALEAAGWSPDGTRVVTASDDGTARVWSAVTGEPLLTFGGQTATITAVAWSPDGSRVVTAAEDGTARVWSAATGEPLVPLLGHRDAVKAAGWSPDGTRIVTAAGGAIDSPDTTARVWDAGTGKEILVFKEHVEEVSAAAWHPDGERIATASMNGVLVWEARTGVVSARLKGLTGARSVAFSPDGTRIVVACIDGLAYVVDPTKGDRLATLRGHRGWIDAAAWSLDGTRIVTASQDRTARVWNVLTGQALNSARVTRARSGAMRAELQAHAGVVLSVTVAPSGETRTPGAQPTWAALTGEAIVVLHGDGWRAAWSPDGTRVVTCSNEGGVLLGGGRVWDAETGESLATFHGHTDYINAVAWSPDGAEIATGADDRTARVWDAETGKARIVLEGHPEPVKSAGWSLDRKKIVTVCDHSMWLWDAKTGKALDRVEAPEQTILLGALSPDGERGVMAFAVGTACVLEMGTREPGTTLQGHTGDVRAAAWSPDGTRIVTGSRDGTARVWSAATGEALATLRGHEEEVSAVGWSPDGTRIVTGSHDNTARVWDGRTGELLSTHVGHTHWIYTAGFSPDGTRIATASHDGTARVWSIDPEHLRDRLWQATPYGLPAARRTELIDEDAITAEKNAKAHREEEARRRAARPVLDVKVVVPDFEEQRRSRAPAVAAAPPAEAAPAAPTSAPAEPAAQAAPASAPASDDLQAVLGELRALFQGAEQKVGDLLSRLAQRLPP